LHRNAETSDRNSRHCVNFDFLGDRLQNGSRYAIRPLSVLSVLTVLSVCNVGILWPNGWMDQDETWHAGRPRPWQQCVRWGPSSSPKRGQSPLTQFSAHVYCCQTAGWIKMALGMEAGLGPGHIVLDGDPVLPPPKRGTAPPSSNLRPMSIVANRPDGSRWHLARRWALAQATS